MVDPSNTIGASAAPHSNVTRDPCDNPHDSEAPHDGEHPHSEHIVGRNVGADHGRDRAVDPEGGADLGETEPSWRGERQCAWCANHFVIARRPGRPRLYCRQSCRQRAYERRSGAGVLPPSDRIIMRPGGPIAPHRHDRPAYERGRIRPGTGRHHAMRPAGIVDDQGRRFTLCGLLARGTSGSFSEYEDGACLTCTMVSRARPPARPVRVSNELAALRALLDVAAADLDRCVRAGSDARRARDRAPVRGPGQILTELVTGV
ncbi:MAG: hypothetical protein JWM34_2271 [Ilumatobacteraceae bacterium]|nr:hypothetical protein [Ilumatobacteraceae bacterium]